jgi:hypothetical protein
MAATRLKIRERIFWEYVKNQIWNSIGSCEGNLDKLIEMILAWVLGLLWLTSGAPTLEIKQDDCPEQRLVQLILKLDERGGLYILIFITMQVAKSRLFWIGDAQL